MQKFSRNKVVYRYNEKKRDTEKNQKWDDCKVIVKGKVCKPAKKKV